MAASRETAERGRRMILSIDSAACTGAGTCEAMHPELFRVVPPVATPVNIWKTIRFNPELPSAHATATADGVGWVPPGTPW
jgi:ferredoxin